MEHPIISSDGHSIEPPDLWKNRMGRKFKDRAPRLVSEQQGDWWYVEGYKLMSLQHGVQPGEGLRAPDRLTTEARWEQVRKGGYIPAERIKDMDLDGIAGEVVYPTIGLRLFTLPDGELMSAIFRAYNDWLAEFCAPYPDRMKGVAMINLDDIGEAVTELKRTRRLGLVGAMIPHHPPERRSYERSLYEPFWAAAEDLGMPLSLHSGTSRVIPKSTSPLRDSAGIRTSRTTFTQAVNKAGWVQESLTNIIIAGVFERYPRLRVGSVEMDLGWAPYWVQAMDKAYRVFGKSIGWDRLKGDALPSDFVRKNLFFSFQDDRLGIQHRDTLGVDTLLWGSDYPHQDATFPMSKKILGSILEGLPQEEKAKIAGLNSAALYGFPYQN